MITVLVTEGGVRQITAEEARTRHWANCQDRNNWKTYEQAQDVAQRLTEASGLLYLASDRGESVSPRFDVIRAPQIGDEVSKYFNGDSYPCGVIIKISKTMRVVTTDTGAKFYRRNERSGSWHSHCWSMIGGHVDERNPHF